MSFRRAVYETAIRFIVLNVALLGLTIPAKILRAAYFPEGLPGDILLLVVLSLICSSVILLFTYVSAPLWRWWKERERQLRAELEQM